MGSTISDVIVKTIDGNDKKLSEYMGKVLLIVNVASQEQGLKILGFPCNDFGQQEPGSNKEITDFCTINYGVTFELFDKIHAKGEEQHPLYAKLTTLVEPIGPIAWNFEKFLVNKHGEVVARFKSSVKPNSPELISAIERELA